MIDSILDAIWMLRYEARIWWRLLRYRLWLWRQNRKGL